ncbi:MAG: FecR domain-containing protein [Pseudomonadota bacterium]|nr:FecR domain-containing protein [Pseudomonadota bacterium]
MNGFRHVSAAMTAAIFVTASARAEPVPRVAPAAGSVIATQIGEEIEFVDAPSWRNVEVLQDVKAGDVLRTNAQGQLAILFSDQTQIRVARNSTLVVKERIPGGDTRLSLEAGQIFARAARGGPQVYVETAAATAAIRGTDWTMRVDGDRTTLSVLEGAVELSNPQGSVTVRQGEAAAATLGSAPSKIVIIADDVHEQMLVNVTVRAAFEAFPVATMQGSSLSAARERLNAVPLANRGSSERVLAAEIALDRDGMAAAIKAVRQARQLPLSASEDARLTFVEALIAGRAGRYGEAARLFDKARPRLSGEQAMTATYQSYFARSLADPTLALPRPPLDRSNRISVAGDALITAIVDSPRAALEAIKLAEPRFRNDALFQAFFAQIALIASDYDTAKIAVDRASALDPSDPEVLSTRSDYKAGVAFDLEGARADAEAALALAPGSSTMWNNYGLILDTRGADREAEAAFLKAVELDPLDPVALANLALFYLDHGRIEKARALIDRALEVDPAFDVALFVRGRQHMLEGDREAALDSFLRATTANPGFANGLLALGALHAADGEIDLAEQAFENADRLDPNAPEIPQYRAALALYEYQADEAIRFARESVRRTEARGGDYESIRATRDGGSIVGSAYRNLSLNAWGRYYGDLTFDSFESGGYFDQAIAGTAPVFALDRGLTVANPDSGTDSRFLSLLAQGLLFDPSGLVGSELSPAFLATPFFETNLTGGFRHRDDRFGGFGDVTVQTLGYLPIPYSLLASVSYDRIGYDYAEQRDKTVNATIGFGLEPTPYDRIAAFGTATFSDGGLALPTARETFFDRNGSDAGVGFIGWSHTFAYHNILNVAVFGQTGAQTRSRLRPDPYVGLFPTIYDFRTDADQVKVSASHLVELGGITLRYGGEVGRSRQTVRRNVVIEGEGERAEILDETDRDEVDRARGWLDATVEFTPHFQAEGGVFVRHRASDAAGSDDDIDGRIGAAFMPIDGQWLRAAYLQQRPEDDGDTLAPVALLGLRANAIPSAERVESAIVRWDSEWSPWFFTALDYQHQELEDLSLSIPNYDAGILIEDGTIDRIAASADVWIGDGLGASLTVARNFSEGSLPGTESRLPYVPDWNGRLAFTYVDPRRFTLTLAETYLGDRLSSENGLVLDDAFVTDISGSWESENRRIRIDAGVYNIFDEAIEVAPLVPTAGRMITASVKARF